MGSSRTPTVIERRSVVDASADRVWQRVVTPEGINDEVGPWMTMSLPRGAQSLNVDNVPVGTPIGRAWLRLFGVLPFDYDFLTIAELVPGRSFREESTMLSMSRWQHERSVTPDGDTKAVVHDRITFQPRVWLRFATPSPGRRSLRCSGTAIVGCSVTSPERFGASGATGVAALT